MTRLVLVRHGETDWNRARRVQGRTDIPLNDTGRAQARRTAAALAGQHWDRIYASPLSRAFETAQLMAGTLGLPAPEAVDALMERNYGEAEGLTGQEVEAHFPGSVVVPGRERRSHAVARALPALAQLAEDHPGGSILVVTHGGLIRSLLMRLEPDDGDHHTEAIPNGSVHSLDYADGVFALVGFNEELIVPGEGDDDITEQNPVEGREAARE